MRHSRGSKAIPRLNSQQLLEGFTRRKRAAESIRNVLIGHALDVPNLRELNANKLDFSL